MPVPKRKVGSPSKLPPVRSSRTVRVQDASNAPQGPMQSAKQESVGKGSRSAATEVRILDAAEIVFARRGLEGTRVREIAEAAEVNGATLYNYYPSKRALYEAVLDRGVSPLTQLLSEYAKGPHERAATVKLVEAVMQHLQERPHLSRLIYLESIAEGEYLQQMAEKWFRPLTNQILSELRAGVVTAGIDERMFPVFAALFMHLSFGHFSLAPLLRAVFDYDPLSDSGVAQETQLIVGLIHQMFPDLSNSQEVRQTQK